MPCNSFHVQMFIFSRIGPLYMLFHLFCSHILLGKPQNWMQMLPSSTRDMLPQLGTETYVHYRYTHNFAIQMFEDRYNIFMNLYHCREGNWRNLQQPQKVSLLLEHMVLSFPQLIPGGLGARAEGRISK